MPLECIIDNCHEPRHNQNNKLCLYCLRHANDRNKRYAKKNPVNNSKYHAKWRKNFKKKNGVSPSTYYYNKQTGNEGSSIARHTTKKIAELCRIIDDQNDVIAGLKKELEQYKMHTGETE